MRDRIFYCVLPFVAGILLSGLFFRGCVVSEIRNGFDRLVPDILKPDDRRIPFPYRDGTLTEDSEVVE